MVDVVAFPTVRNIHVHGDNITPYTAGAAITAGHVVGIHGTGVTKTVHPFVTGTHVAPVGVALYSVASGAQVAVAGPGCRVNVVNGIQGTDFDAGTYVEAYGTGAAGTVKALVTTGGVAVNTKVVGLALENNTATVTGTASEVLITLGVVTPGA